MQLPSMGAADLALLRIDQIGRLKAALCRFFELLASSQSSRDFVLSSLVISFYLFKPSSGCFKRSSSACLRVVFVLQI